MCYVIAQTLHYAIIALTKGLPKLGNIVAETLLRMQMFPSLDSRETCVAETNVAARKTKNVFACSQGRVLPGHKFCVRNMFPSLATRGTITRNIVSATMFPSLARP